MRGVRKTVPASRVLVLSASLVLSACSDAPGTPVDAGTDVLPDTGGGFTTCEGACRTTALTAVMATTRMLDRAYYGITTSASGTTLHVEAYFGGAPGCPTMDSPPTDYTLVLGRVPVPTSTTPSTSPGSILDFAGDLLDGPLGAMATAVTLDPVAANPTEGFVALDIALTFAAGTVMGHLFATHCTELDAQE